jgi:pimeloyl-ACP methyl ester carboxylesterase
MLLVDRAKEVLNELARRDIGAGPIVLVCHSLGGLVAKQLLRTASDDAAPPAWRKFADQTKGVAFVATPHAGRTSRARCGVSAGRSARAPRSTTLRAHAPALRQLTEWCRGFAWRTAQTHVWDGPISSCAPPTHEIDAGPRGARAG